MKKLLLIALVIALGCTVQAGEFDQTKGNVRVVLLSIERGRTFLPVRRHPKIQPGAPFVRITYMLECFGEQPIETNDLGDINFWYDGKRYPLAKREGAQFKCSTRESLSRHALSPFELSSKVQPERQFGFEVLVFGEPPDLDKAELRIKAGFNGETYDFRFMDVPLK